MIITMYYTNDFGDHGIFAIKRPVDFDIDVWFEKCKKGMKLLGIYRIEYEKI